MVCGLPRAEQTPACPPATFAVDYAAPRGARQKVAEPKTRKKARQMPLYKVLLHNDDLTPMDFVMRVLTQIYRKSHPEALEIMMRAHRTQIALVEIVPLEHAEMHVDQARSLARARKFPLTMTYEQA